MLTAGEERRVALHIYIPEYLDYTEVVKISVKPPVGDEKSVYATINVIPYPIIEHLSPADNITTGSTNRIISWTTTTNASSEVYYKMEGEPAFNITTGDFGKEHIVELKNLTRNKAYLWYVKSCNEYGCAQSEIMRFYVSNGIVFTQREYTFNIERDFNQQMEVSVENTDTKTHTLLLQVQNPYDNIYVGFVGSGSTDEIVPLEPGERMDVDFVIHAQNALIENYTLFINLTCTDENITDFAIAHVNVRFPNINFSVEEISIDPLTLSKTFRITNYGDTLTDLCIAPDDSLKEKVIIQPAITHGILRSGVYLDVTLSPIWKNIKNITGNLSVCAANVTKISEVKFECPGEKDLYEVILENPILYFDLKSGFCINRGHIEDYFHLPPGFDADDVKYAYVGVELNAGAGQTSPYDVTIAINGNVVGILRRTFPRGYFEFDLEPLYLNYAIMGTASNKFTLDTNMNRGYSTSLSDVRVVLCLEELRTFVCAENESQAYEIAWSRPFIYKPHQEIEVNILAPNGVVNISEPVLIKAKVTRGDRKREKLCRAKVNFSNGDGIITLVDNGRHGDGNADDGIYANTWIPKVPGECILNVSACNCIATDYEEKAVHVEEKEWSFAIITDLHVGYGIPDFGTEGWDDGLTGDPSLDEYYLTERLRAVINWINEHKDEYNIKFVAVLGDITDTAERSEFLKAKEILDELDIPYFPIVGNHDVCPYIQAPGHNPDYRVRYGDQGEISRRYFRETFDSEFFENQSNKLGLEIDMHQENIEDLLNYAFVYKGMKFIFLDFASDEYAPSYQSGIRGDAKLFSETKEWLNEEISEEIPAIALSHHPLTGPTILPYYANIGQAFTDLILAQMAFSRDELIEIGKILMGKNMLANFGGHIHSCNVFLGLVPIEFDANREYGKIVGAPVVTTEAIMVESSEVVRIVQIENEKINNYNILKPEEILKSAINPYITFNPKHISVGTEVEFEAGAKPFLFGISYEWDLNGDGIIDSTDDVPEYVYGSTGSYIVNLTIIDNGDRESVWERITVYPMPIEPHRIIVKEGLHPILIYEGTDVSEVAQNTPELVTIAKSSSGLKLIGDFLAHFENATKDIDLSNMTADANLTARKSVIYMPSWPNEIEESKILYIPSTGKGAVYICKNATSLDEVSFENADVVINVGETKEGMTVATTLYNDTEYYVVFNITGTGGGEFTLTENIFDTRAPTNPYPSIFGTHNGTIKPNNYCVHALHISMPGHRRTHRIHENLEGFC